MVLFEQDIISFKKRYQENLGDNYGIYIYPLFLLCISYWMPWFLIITAVYIGIYFYSNYRVSDVFIYKWVEIEDSYKIDYLLYDEPKSLTLKKVDTRVEVYSNGFGISTMVSYHLKVSERDETKLDQYKGGKWNKKFMLEFVKNFDNSTTYSR